MTTLEARNSAPHDMKDDFNPERLAYPFVVTPSSIAGWDVTFPDLPGVVGQAETLADVGETVREVLDLYSDEGDYGRRPMPTPSGWRPDWLREEGESAPLPSPALSDPAWAAHEEAEVTLPRWTTREVADRLERTRGRIDQIARDLGLGTMVGNQRLFSVREFDMIRAHRKPAGRPAKGASAGDHSAQARA